MKVAVKTKGDKIKRGRGEEAQLRNELAVSIKDGLVNKQDFAR